MTKTELIEQALTSASGTATKRHEKHGVIIDTNVSADHTCAIISTTQMHASHGKMSVAFNQEIR